MVQNSLYEPLRRTKEKLEQDVRKFEDVVRENGEKSGLEGDELLKYVADAVSRYEFERRRVYGL